MVLAINRPDVRYTYADYLLWDGNERWELIDGLSYNMSPAPSRKYQEISQLTMGIFSDLVLNLNEIFTE